MSSRFERDSFGTIEVDDKYLWGAQTERSRRNFKAGAGHELMPAEMIKAIAVVKKACAQANSELKPEKMTPEKAEAIESACDEIISGKLNDQFPLVVFQTGSGTQTNMNVNEVIAHLAGSSDGKPLLHANDDVNMSQSTNDVFPSAMHIAAAESLVRKLIPALEKLTLSMKKLELVYPDAVKSGRTHLQDAVPVSFAQEVSGWRFSIEKDIALINKAVESLYDIALGGTATGTGLNAPEGFDVLACGKIAEITGMPFRASENKFHSLSSKDELVFAHGALKALAGDLMKIANDVRLLASGPRNGLGEISIPSNEPGSSIMPGKVNPTQCEAVTMVACRVFGNDASIGFAASQGNFELNVFMPVMIYDFLQSSRLLADVVESFDINCVSGIKADREKMKSNLNSSLMTATALSPYIGYDSAAKTVKKAFEENISLREACVALGFMTAEEFDSVYKPEEMI